MSEICQHKWVDDYYGTKRVLCETFYPFGCAPWDDFADSLDEELDEYEAFDCHMNRNGYCGAAGSEDCEFECPYRRDQYARERKKAERKRNKNGRQADLLPPKDAP